MFPGVYGAILPRIMKESPRLQKHSGALVKHSETGLPSCVLAARLLGQRPGKDLFQTAVDDGRFSRRDVVQISVKVL